MVKITADSLYPQLINYKTWSKLSSWCENSKEITDSPHEQQPIKTVCCETTLVLSVLILGFSPLHPFKQRTLYKDFKLALGFSYSVSTTYQVPIILAEPFFFSKGALPVSLHMKRDETITVNSDSGGLSFLPWEKPQDTVYRQQTCWVSDRKSSLGVQR